MDEVSQKSVPTAEFPRGTAKARIDDKGRLKLSAEYSHYFDSLSERKVYVTSLDRRIAEIYPIAAWRVMEDWLAANEGMAEAWRASNNASLLGGECDVDGQGRVTVNAELRRVLGLDGQELHIQPYKRNRIRILSQKAFADMMEQLESAAADNRDEEALRKAGRP